MVCWCICLYYKLIINNDLFKRYELYNASTIAAVGAKSSTAYANGFTTTGKHGFFIVQYFIELNNTPQGIACGIVDAPLEIHVPRSLLFSRSIFLSSSSFSWSNGTYATAFNSTNTAYTGCIIPKSIQYIEMPI